MCMCVYVCKLVHAYARVFVCMSGVCLRLRVHGHLLAKVGSKREKRETLGKLGGGGCEGVGGVCVCVGGWVGGGVGGGWGGNEKFTF